MIDLERWGKTNLEVKKINKILKIIQTSLIMSPDLGKESNQPEEPVYIGLGWSDPGVG